MKTKRLSRVCSCGYRVVIAKFWRFFAPKGDGVRCPKCEGILLFNTFKEV